MVMKRLAVTVATTAALTLGAAVVPAAPLHGVPGRHAQRNHIAPKTVTVVKQLTVASGGTVGGPTR